MKAWKLYKDGVFTDMKMPTGGADETKRLTPTMRTNDASELDAVYEWYKDAPVRSRVTKRMWHRQMSLERACAEPPLLTATGHEYPGRGVVGTSRYFVG